MSGWFINQALARVAIGPLAQTPPDVVATFNSLSSTAGYIALAVMMWVMNKDLRTSYDKLIDKLHMDYETRIGFFQRELSEARKHQIEILDRTTICSRCHSSSSSSSGN